MLVTGLTWPAFGSAQSRPTLNASAYIFWQPQLKLDAADYTGKPHDATKPAIAGVAIWSVLDLPKETKNNGEKKAAIYLAPVFDKSNSSTITNDTLQIAMQNTYLDICEIWARWARQEMEKTEYAVKNTDSVSMAFISVLKQMNEHRLRMYRKYNREVFREKQEGAYDRWRQTVLSNLNDTKKWATRSDECSRFIINQPILEGYEEDKRSNPPLLGKYEQVLQNDTWHGIFSQVSRYAGK